MMVVLPRSLSAGTPTMNRSDTGAGKKVLEYRCRYSKLENTDTSAGTVDTAYQLTVHSGEAGTQDISYIRSYSAH